MILTPPPTGGQQILRHALGRRWRTIAAGTVVGMLLGVGAAFVIPVTHSATVSMTVTSPTLTPAPAIRASLSNTTDMVTEQGIAKSAAVLDVVAARLGNAAGFDLVAQSIDDGRRGTEPRDTGILDGACKLGVLRQKAVAGMNRICTRLQCDCEDLLTVQICRRRVVATQGQGLVGLARMGGRPLLVGVNRDRRNAHIGGRAAHAQSDFATVGDEDSINCSHASPWCRERLSEEFR